MTTKEEQVKAVVHIRQSWVKDTTANILFKSANVALGHDDTVAILATQLDISDSHFVAVTFYPPAFAKTTTKAGKVYIPKDAVRLIAELNDPAALSALGYKYPTGTAA